MPSTPQVEYTVRLRPEQHELDVTMVLRGPAASGTFSLQIPTWVPGSYSFDIYARDLFNLTATDLASGKTLAVHRDGWQGFRIDGADGELKVSYSAYAYAVEYAEPCGIVATDWAILLGTRYLYAPKHLGPCRVHYQLPEGWSAIHHPSGAQKIDDRTWDYPSYEILLDTPVAMGTFDLYVRKVGPEQTPFYFLFVDRGVGFAEGVEDLVGKVAQVAEGFRDIFGSFPFSDYTFLLSLNPNADWGLEHLTSTMCGLGPDVFTVPDQTATGVRVCAHELFHAWNVRRLRPSPLKNLDTHLECGCFTEGLWVAEGFTRYYEFLASTRVGAYTPEQFFSAVMGYYQHLTIQPAYERVSGVDSSLATFLNHSKYAGRVNNSIDYYDKGMLIAFELDSVLRRETQNDTLDTAFAAFYQAYVAGGPSHAGYSTEEVVGFFEAIHPGLGALLTQGAEHPGGLSVPEQFERLGFTLTLQQQHYLGLVFRDVIGAEILDVIDISPAGGSGIAPADVITMVNGFAFSPQALQWAAANSGPVTLTVLRGHLPLSFTITPVSRATVQELIWVGSAAQAGLIAKWLGQAFAPAAGQVFSLDFYENFHGVEIVV